MGEVIRSGTAAKTDRGRLVAEAVYEVCDPHVRHAVARNEHPDRYLLKRVAERALRALQDRGDLPATLDVTVTVSITGGTKQHKLHIGYANAMYAWIDEVAS